MLKVVNGQIYLDNDTMDYIRFGSGSRVMVLIPGVGDGLKTVRGMALPFAFLYRILAKDFTVYMFSRRNRLAPGTGTREMAEDLDRAMEMLGIRTASVMGISQGGMIAQWLAVDHPDKVERLVLAVTLGRPNPKVRRVIGRWMTMAEKGEYKKIMLDTARRSYTPSRLKKIRGMYSLLGNVGKPKSFGRFLVQAQSCLTHDAWDDLDRITCPTLVIGGTEDGIVTGQASVELAEKIPGSVLHMYDGLSHGLYEEAKDFLPLVMAFCSGKVPGKPQRCGKTNKKRRPAFAGRKIRVRSKNEKRR